MKVLVTGGAGFIGSHIAERLVREGHSVRVLDNLSSGKRENLAHVSGVELAVADLRDAARVDELAAGCEVIFHEGAVVSVPYSVEHPQETHDVNIQGTLNVLLAARARRVRRVVFACSAAVYGEDPVQPKVETMRAAPVSPYGVEKIASEQYLHAWSQLYGVETVSLRYFNVFGPRQDPSSPYSGVISIFVSRILKGEPITIFGDGEQYRDFVFVDNVVDANLRAATREGISGRAFNVACGVRTSLNDLATMLGRITGQKVVVRHADPRAGDIRESLADISLARHALGYEPLVGVEQGLARLLRHEQGR
jgi:UDP-N-acetylglucosamine/UDP-N-acetyl-alpha-D-glucosaminouronate 4-epimerase